MDNTLAQSLTTEIANAVRGLRPLSSLFAAFYIAEQQRLATVFDELAQVEAEIRNCCAERDASARQLVALAGKDRAAPARENAIPSVRRVAS